MNRTQEARAPLGRADGSAGDAFDHIVIAAAHLDDGAAWLHDRLGVSMSGGGRHRRMGTHNRLLRLGDGRYLEVIAVDAAAPAPDRPRWFGLDQPAMQARLAHEPRIVGWAARTAAIAEVAARSPIPVGVPEPMSRGGLSWLITIPADGSLPDGGAFPSLIAWPADRPHPSEGLPDQGCRLLGFEIGHPQRTRLEHALASIGFDGEDGLVRVVAAPHVAFAALIATPDGECRIASGGASWD
jgi:glyoxalase-like protein